MSGGTAKERAQMEKEAQAAFEHNFKGLDYSHVGRKELAIDFATTFAMRQHDAGREQGIEESAQIADREGQGFAAEIRTLKNGKG